MIEIYALTSYGNGLSKSIDAPQDDLAWKIIYFLAFRSRATMDELKARFGDTATLRNSLNRLQRHKPPIVIKEGAEPI
jgi:hypothetical protein